MNRAASGFQAQLGGASEEGSPIPQKLSADTLEAKDRL